MIRNNKRQRGVTIIEVTISMLLLLLVVGIVAQTVVSVNQQRRLAMQRMLASQEVANQMERVSTLAWGELDAANFKWSPDEDLARRLPNCDLNFTSKPITEPLPAKRVTLEMTWKDPAGRSIEPVRLVRWIYQTESSE